MQITPKTMIFSPGKTGDETFLGTINDFMDVLCDDVALDIDWKQFYADLASKGEYHYVGSETAPFTVVLA